MSQQRFLGKRVALGVTGSIAAYKAVELVRRLIEEAAEVSVVMTEAATRFVTPLTFEVLSGRPVARDLFAAHEEMVHLSLAEESDLVLIAPATAHALARAALGLADDLLGTLLLAARCPIVLAPAMDGGMWHHPTVQEHVARLRARGITVVDPDDGPLASGKVGKGRLADLQAILAAAQAAVGSRQDLAGARVLISAGPTQEPLDPIRYISNRSSGKMGYALAAAARARGATVVLVSGPTALPVPAGVEVVPVMTAEDMAKALSARLPWATVVIMTAAVADCRPTKVSEQKLERKSLSGNLALEPTQDILADLAARSRGQILVGFAAETGPVLPRAAEKLRRKNLDLLVANDVTQEGAGFGSETNIVTLVDRQGGVTELPKMDKRQLADRILDAILSLPRSTADRRSPSQS